MKRDRIKNGVYRDRLDNIVEVTDSMQPLYITGYVMNLFTQEKYIVSTSSGQDFVIPHSAVTDAVYKKSWQSKAKERVIPCDIDYSLIPKKANYNFDVKAYCKDMCGSGCPALKPDYKSSTWTCEYKKISKSEYEDIISFCSPDEDAGNSGDKPQ